MTYYVEIWSAEARRWVRQPQTFHNPGAAQHWLDERSHGAEARVVRDRKPAVAKV